MRHQDLTINHRLESFIFANKTDRDNGTGYTFVAGDIGRISYTSNSGQYHRLLTVAPTWGLIGSAGILAYASVQTAIVAAPGTTTSTTGVMMGLGSTAKLTPAVSGKVIIHATGNIFNTVANIQAVGILRYGITTPIPVNGGSPAGAIVGSQVSIFGNPKAANFAVPFALTGVILGQAIGTEVWFDVQIATSAGGTAGINTVTIAAIELP